MLVDPQEGHTGDQLDHSQPGVKGVKCYYWTAKLTGGMT